MTATAHALAGGAIAASINNPALGIVIATASHPLLDMIPHWDFGCGWRKKTKLKLFIEGTLDLTVGVVLSYLIFGHNVNPWYFFSCIFFSEIWDLIEIPYWFLNWKFFPFGAMYKLQSRIQGRTSLFWGILTQAGTIMGLTFFLQNLH